MCRIIGHLGAGLSARSLWQVARLQHAGGPDGRYLAATDDLGVGRQPAGDHRPSGRAAALLPGRSIHVVFNGEIYNHRELRARLESWGYRLPDECDGSVLPGLYQRYGERFTEHLDGMYAIAVLDLRAEPTLVLTTRA